MSAASDRLPRNRAGQGAPRRRPGIAATALNGMVSRPMTTLAIIASAGLAAAIVVNAVGLQQKAHPAPLFSARPVAQAQPAPQVPPAQPGRIAQPPARPASVAPTDIASLSREASAAQDTSLPATISFAPPARPSELGLAPSAPPAPAPAAPPRDAIADLLRGQADKPREAGQPTSTASLPAADPRIASAQRALTKLGYGPLKPDGISGIGTRLAIESFEKDRRLPLTGELSLRLMRELAAASGIAID